MSTDFDQLYDALAKQHILLIKQRDTINREIANIGSMKLLVYPYVTTKLNKAEAYLDGTAASYKAKVTRANSKIGETAGDLPWDA